MMFRMWIGGVMAEHRVIRIPVIFTNGEIGNIHGSTLDYLIRGNDIAAFRRSEGWVQVGRDQIRESQELFRAKGKRWDDGPIPRHP